MYPRVSKVPGTGVETRDCLPNPPASLERLHRQNHFHFYGGCEKISDSLEMQMAFTGAERVTHPVGVTLFCYQVLSCFWPQLSRHVYFLHQGWCQGLMMLTGNTALAGLLLSPHWLGTSGEVSPRTAPWVPTAPWQLVARPVCSSCSVNMNDNIRTLKKNGHQY